MKPASSEPTQASTDVPDRAAPDLERRLSRIAELDRRLGSRRLVGRFLWSWFQSGATYRVLDLSAGSGDIARFIAIWCEEHGVSVRIDAVESHAATLEVGRKQSAKYGNIEWIPGDPLTHASPVAYDFVYCSLAAHRLGEEDTVRLLSRCRELSDQFVVIADLERSAVTRLCVWFLTSFIVRDPDARAYGKACAKKAFSWVEMRHLAKAAGWEQFGQARFLLCNQAIWLFTRDYAEIPLIAAPVTGVLPCPT